MSSNYDDLMRAVLSEREACALHLEEVADRFPGEPVTRAALRGAAAGIRRRPLVVTVAEAAVDVEITVQPSPEREEERA